MDNYERLKRDSTFYKLYVLQYNEIRYSIPVKSTYFSYKTVWINSLKEYIEMIDKRYDEVQEYLGKDVSDLFYYHFVERKTFDELIKTDGIISKSKRGLMNLNTSLRDEYNSLNINWYKSARNISDKDSSSKMLSLMKKAKKDIKTINYCKNKIEEFENRAFSVKTRSLIQLDTSNSSRISQKSCCNYFLDAIDAYKEELDLRIKYSNLILKILNETDPAIKPMIIKLKLIGDSTINEGASYLSISRGTIGKWIKDEIDGIATSENIIALEKLRKEINRAAERRIKYD